ncbi:hypothetical protein B566_EDAN018273 [Ephemera danica]|nr:hypothetical protein B566_EDAN018273 [Ephemera danica]
MNTDSGANIESATSLCKLRGNSLVELAHWLHQIAHSADSDVHRITRHFELDLKEIIAELNEALLALPGGASSISNFSHHIEVAIERAWVVASLGFSDNKIRTGHLLLAMLQTQELRRELLESCPSLRNISVDTLSQLLPTLTESSPEAKDLAYDGSGMAQVQPGEASNAFAASDTKTAMLERFCTNLTELARIGKIDPVIGREQEIRTMTDILLRRRQNNPLLTGEAGVGKTAVVEGLALAISTKAVPPALQNVRLLSLDVGALLAGASMKGEFESRLKGVLEEAGQSAVPIILFVDEVHTLIGAGGNAGTGDAANLLKPALARGGLRTIGATTWSEYKRHIEKDAALTRRFQVLQIAEPEEAIAITMVRGLTPTFEAHHNVLILDEAIAAAVTLSHRYIPARQLPDKAISLLDTACARVALSLHTPPSELQFLTAQRDALNLEAALHDKQVKLGRSTQQTAQVIRSRLHETETAIATLEARWAAERDAVQALLDARQKHLANTQKASSHLPSLMDLEDQLAKLRSNTSKALVHPEVSEASVAMIVSEWTGIPIGRMVKDEITAVLTLAEQLCERVIGQQHALNQISQRIQVSRARMSDPGKPVGVFLLTGPSGVGKTETALALAERLYGGEQNLITINMSEFQEAHTVSTLKGAPPGYVGYGEGGVLTEAVRRHPYSVILLDEIEKAHHDVHEIFFQVFDKGWMEDGEGRQIDFRNTVILLTSNVGVDTINQLCADPALMPAVDVLCNALQPELLHVFPAAFLGRLTVIPYLPLQQEILASIVNLQLNRVAKRAAEQHGICVEYSSDIVSYIINQCQATQSGARLFIGYIEQQILPIIGKIWLESMDQQTQVTRVRLVVQGGRIASEVSFAAPPVFSHNKEST